LLSTWPTSAAEPQRDDQIDAQKLQVRDVEPDPFRAAEGASDAEQQERAITPSPDAYGVRLHHLRMSATTAGVFPR
jgi:hypothetical protein